jgi:hypothetical protein
MRKDNPRMVQALRDRVGLSEDDAKRTVLVVEEVLADEQAQQPKAPELRLGDRNPFKDAVVTERSGYLSFGALFGRRRRRKRRQPSATV